MPFDGNSWLRCESDEDDEESDMVVSVVVAKDGLNPSQGELTETMLLGFPYRAGLVACSLLDRLDRELATPEEPFKVSILNTPSVESVSLSLLIRPTVEKVGVFQIAELREA